MGSARSVTPDLVTQAACKHTQSVNFDSTEGSSLYLCYLHLLQASSQGRIPQLVLCDIYWFPLLFRNLLTSDYRFERFTECVEYFFIHLFTNFSL